MKTRLLNFSKRDPTPLDVPSVSFCNFPDNYSVDLVKHFSPITEVFHQTTDIIFESNNYVSRFPLCVQVVSPLYPDVRGRMSLTTFDPISSKQPLPPDHLVA